jgi:hypothetical protein
MYTIAMGIPRQPLILEVFKHGRVDGHAEGLSPEPGVEALLRTGSPSKPTVEYGWYGAECYWEGVR